MCVYVVCGVCIVHTFWCGCEHVCVCVATHVSGYVETKGQHEGSLFNVSPSLFFFFFRQSHSLNLRLIDLL